MRIHPGLAAVLAAVVLAGCGGSTSTVTEQATVTVDRPPEKHAGSLKDAFSDAESPSAKSRAKARRAVAKQPASHQWLACDQNVEALRPNTSCTFAQNAFYEYWIADGASPLQVYSPAVGRSFSTRCSSNGFRVSCRTADGGRVRFPTSALDEYSDEQAASYAASHDTGGGPTPSPDPSESASDGSEDPPQADDSAGNEIPNYDNGTGYRVQCADGMYSKSGGRPGACSGHGGVR